MTVSGCFDYRSSPLPEVENSVMKECRKFTGEHPCRSVTLRHGKQQLYKITPRHGRSLVNLLQLFRTPFPKNTSEELLLRFLQKIITTKSRSIFLQKGSCSI